MHPFHLQSAPVQTCAPVVQMSRLLLATEVTGPPLSQRIGGRVCQYPRRSCLATHWHCIFIGAACSLHSGSPVNGLDAGRCRSPGGSAPPGGGGPPGGGAPGGGLGPGTGPCPAGARAPGGASSPAAGAGAPVAGTAAVGWPPELPSCPDLAAVEDATEAAGACCCGCSCAAAAWVPAAASPAAVPGAAGSSDCSGGACWAAPLAPAPVLAVSAAVDSSWLPVVAASGPSLPAGGLLGLLEVAGGVASAAAAGTEAADDGIEAGVTAGRTAAGGGPDGGRGPGTAAAAEHVARLHQPLSTYGWLQGQGPLDWGRLAEASTAAVSSNRCNNSRTA